MPRKNRVTTGNRPPDNRAGQQVKQIIYNVYCFMEKENKDGVNNFKQVQRRAAEATNTSLATVGRIMKENASEFRTPGKNRLRPKPITGVDSFDEGVIKRCIHNFHITEKVLPTIEKLRQKLRNDINYQGSERSLRRIVKNLGFKWKKTEITRQILIETPNIRFKRIAYLQQISKYRQQGRPIIYTNESYVDISRSTSNAWTPEVINSCNGIKPISKGQRGVIVHAGSEAGFVPNTLFMFIADADTVDYHDLYEKWLRNQFMANLPNNSVVIVGNAPYHIKQYNPAPTSSDKKYKMRAWLTEKGINYTEHMLKPQLYDLIESHKNKYKTYKIDKILAENNHDVLRLPPYHADLNPIEMAWAAHQGYISSKNVNWSITGATVADLIKDKVDLISVSDWKNLCNRVKQIEDQYKKVDPVVDAFTEEFIIRVDANDSDSDTDDGKITRRKMIIRKW